MLAGFMRIRKMPLERLTYPLIDVEEVARGIRKVILSDRALHESVRRPKPSAHRIRG